MYNLSEEFINKLIKLAQEKLISDHPEFEVEKVALLPTKAFTLGEKSGEVALARAIVEHLNLINLN